MSASDVAVIIAAGVQAATVILGIGALSQKLTDVRDDMREIRQGLQNFLVALAAQPKQTTNCEPPKPKEPPIT